MVKICRTGLLKLNFEIVPKKRIFRFLAKISAGHAWSWKFFFANFQILGPLGCQEWVVLPQNGKKSQNHCTLMYRPLHRLLLAPSSFSPIYPCCNSCYIALVLPYESRSFLLFSCTLSRAPSFRKIKLFHGVNISRPTKSLISKLLA